jgi:hypothetical protein
MNAKFQPSMKVLIRRRDAWMKKLAEVGPPLRGSLCSVQRGNHTAHQLTVSVKGKTHTVYVPIEKVEEVTEWIQNHRTLQRILKELSKLNMALIHRHVPESRGDDRGRARNPRRS